MKKLLLIASLVIGFISQAQVKTDYNQYGGSWKILETKNGFRLPGVTTGTKDLNAGPQIGDSYYNQTEKYLYIHDGITWVKYARFSDVTSGVTSVAATSPITSSGGNTPVISTSMATGSLIYRKTAGTGVMEVNTLSTLKTDLGLTGTNSGDQTTTGTTNRITVTNGSTNPVIDISVTYVGQTSITTLGTVATGVWNATIIGKAYGGTGEDNSTGGTANTFWARPNGSTGAASYRAIVAADIPTLNQTTTGSAATLTTPRTISMTGDAAWTVTFDGSGNVIAAGTLATVNSNVGTWNNVTVNAKGLVTSASNVAYLTTNQTITLSGDVTGSGTTAITTTLATVNSNIGTFTNATITVNGKGLITAASSGTTAVTSVSAISPITSSGGTTPVISTSMATASVIYRKTAGTGVMEVNTLATLKTDLGLTGTNSGDQTITLTGGVTGTGTGSFATTVVTNANLTGPITSVGNATSIASQTGTGTTFAMNTSPLFVTPRLNSTSTTGYVWTATDNVGNGSFQAAASGGITTLNTLTATTQLFATGTSGTDFNISSSVATHTFNFPSSSGSNRGLLTSTDWTTFNIKQATLVSGTNIKTINSVSVLGSGNMLLDLQAVTTAGASTTNAIAFGNYIDVQQAMYLTGDISPTSLSGNVNNYNPTSLSTSSTLRLTSSLDVSITGLQGNVDGAILFIHNVGSFKITLINQSASSTAAYRFALSGDVTIGPNQTAFLRYDAVDSRWRVMSEHVSSAGAYVTSVSGTTNRITVTGGLAAVVDISSSYVGQSTITTHGTITSGGLGTGSFIGGTTMTLGSDASYDVYYRGSGGVLTRLGMGTTGQFLSANTGSAPSWATPTAATVTGASSGLSVSSGNVILGGNALSANATIATSANSLTMSSSNATGTLILNNSTYAALKVSSGVIDCGNVTINTTTGVGINITTTTGSLLNMATTPSSTNSITDAILINTMSSGGAGANGIGSAMYFGAETSNNGQPQYTTAFISKWSVATVTALESVFIIQGGYGSAAIKDVATFTASPTGANLKMDGQMYSAEFAAGSATALDFNNGNNQSETLNGNRTFTFSNMKSGGRYLVKIKQDGTGSRIPTWPTVSWQGGTTPTATITANKTDFFYFYFDGTTIYGEASLNF